MGIAVDADGRATYEFDLEWNVPAIDDLSKYGHLHTGSIAATLEPGGTAVVENVRAIRDHATTSYDPNIRPALMIAPEQVVGRVEDLVSLSDLVKVSDEDLEWLYPGEPVEDVMRRWIKAGPSMVVVTRGPWGAYALLADNRDMLHIDQMNVTVGDTVDLAYVDQSRDSLNPDATVFEEITGGVEHMKIGSKEIHGRAYCASFNFKGSDQQKLVGNLSGGERGRLHLAKTLMTGGNVLLLDEPSNDLDVETLRALEDALLEYAGCALIISHDRWFLDRICTHILAAEGDSQWSFFAGNYQEYEADKRKRLGEEGAKPKRIRYKPITR